MPLISRATPGASALLMGRGLVTLAGTAVTVSLSARLAMLAQDSGHAPWSYKPGAGELSDLCAEFGILVASGKAA